MGTKKGRTCGKGAPFKGAPQRFGWAVAPNCPASIRHWCNDIWNKESACRRICILCQQTTLKRWFGNMNTTSNNDVTNSALQIQMTTMCHLMKPPPWKFSAYATAEISPPKLTCWIRPWEKDHFYVQNHCLQASATIVDKWRHDGTQNLAPLTRQ